MSRDSQRVQCLLRGKQEHLQQQLAEIRDLLEEIASAEADVSWWCPTVPTDNVPDRLGELAHLVRRLFDLEEDERYLEDYFRHQPEVRDGLRRLHAEHDQLLELLEELCELSGTSLQPGSSWRDIELHYRCFERRLAVHQQDENALCEKAGLAAV